MQVSETFKTQLVAAWGQDLSIVVEEAMNELFRHGDEVPLDHDDQVDYAQRIGALVEEMQDQNPIEFINRFEKEILNEE